MKATTLVAATLGLGLALTFATVWVVCVLF
jgi:hypothetical protein